MSWQDRLRQMVLAGGVLAAACGGSESLDKGGTGGNSGTGGSTGTGGTTATGGTTGTGGTFSIPCGNANSDPCICGRPDASAAAADACSKKTFCEANGGVWTLTGPTAWEGHCDRDGGTLFLDGSAAGNDGGAHD